MSNQNFRIEAYTDNDREQILKVWEKSVLLTHDFLKPTDFEEIKTLVHRINFNDFEVYCLKKNKEIAGFIGVVERKIEMQLNFTKNSDSRHTNRLTKTTKEKNIHC